MGGLEWKKLFTGVPWVKKKFWKPLIYIIPHMRCAMWSERCYYLWVNFIKRPQSLWPWAYNKLWAIFTKMWATFHVPDNARCWSLAPSTSTAQKNLHISNLDAHWQNIFFSFFFLPHHHLLNFYFSLSPLPLSLSLLFPSTAPVTVSRVIC